MTKNNRLFFVYKESHVEQHAGDFSVTVRDVRQLTQPESDLLTLLWVLEEGGKSGGGGRCVAAARRRRNWRSLTATVAGACAATGPTP
jgi:hypothetical protein